MHVKNYLLMRYTLIIRLFLLLLPVAGQSQSTYLPLWGKEGWLLDRLEIKSQKESQLNLSAMKPYQRKILVAVADSFRNLIEHGQNVAGLSPVDLYNLNRFEANNSEYSRYNTNTMPNWKSKKSINNWLWPTKGNMFEVNIPDFYVSLNPVTNQQQSRETDFGDRVYVNAKGFALRGLIGKKIGFHFFATDNQELGPQPFRNFLDTFKVVPGAGYWKLFKGDRGVDYFDAKGSVSWAIGRHVTMQFGYDQHFIGNGYRSMLLSNFSPNALFFKANGRWKNLDYTTLLMELKPTKALFGDILVDRKYMAIHHIAYNAAPWLTIGAFEAVTFAGRNKFNLSYFQPVFLVNTLRDAKETKNNVQLGLDVKANIAKQWQVYAQGLIDGLAPNNAKGGDNWWGKRVSYQAGIKYIDALGIANLDWQIELNSASPFTYTAADSGMAYMHYLQPLAHPLGANFKEWIGIIRYQPFAKWYLFGRLNYWQQGVDSAKFNFGGKLTRNNLLLGEGGSRLRNNGYPLLAGTTQKVLNTAITVSYEIKENLFIDLNGMYRIAKTVNKKDVTTSVITVGIRWNMYRREYDY